jgi:uncharacterized repeat protein (TIGR02543 family)
LIIICVLIIPASALAQENAGESPSASVQPSEQQVLQEPMASGEAGVLPDGLNESVITEIKDIAATDGALAAAMLNAHKAENGFASAVAGVLDSYVGGGNAVQWEAFIKTIDIGNVAISATIDTSSIHAVPAGDFSGSLSVQDGQYTFIYPDRLSAGEQAVFEDYIANGGETVKTAFSFTLPSGVGSADVYNAAASGGAGSFDTENCVPAKAAGQAGLFLDIARLDGGGIAMLPVPEGALKIWAVVFRDGSGNVVSAGKVTVNVQTESTGEPQEETTLQDMGAVSGLSGLPYVDGEVLVKFKDNVSAAKKSMTIRSFGIEKEKKNKVSVVKLDIGKTVAQTVAEMKNDPNVQIAQPNYLYSLLETESLTTSVNDPYVINAWYLDNIGMKDAWDYSRTNGTVKVAVLDTGIDLTHPDLNDNIVYSWDAYNNAPLAGDLGFHGTHVAGIIAAEANNGIGVAGVSYNAALVAINVFHNDAELGLVADSATLCGAYDIAMAQGVRVVNMSLGGYFGAGGPGYYDLLLEDKIDQAAAQGIVTVCAGGNGDSNGNPITDPIFPGDYDTCISVVPTDSNNVRATYADYNSYKDISAPGVSILSTLPMDYGTYGGYAYTGGSSMASPMVAGVVAAMIAADPGLTVDEIKTLLYENATDLGTAGYDAYYGWGKVNAYQTILDLTSSFTVTFNSQGGSAVSPISADYGSTITAPAAPTKTGYDFGGWYKESGCINAWNFSSDTVTGDTTLWAKWTVSTYTVTFDSQGGSAVSSISAEYNSIITAPSAPTKTGYNFGGWYKESACVNEWNFATDTVKGNTTLYAKWVNVPPSLVSLGYNTTNPTYAATFNMAANINNGSRSITNVILNVWNTNVGRAGSTYAYDAAYANGQWTAAFDRTNHGDTAGTYSIEVYATDSEGVTYALGYKLITLKDKAPSLSSLTYDTTSPTYATAFNMSAAVDGGSRTITNVKLGVWNTNVGRAGSTYTYDATYANGKWTAAFDRANHGDTAGTYSIEVYAVDSTGKTYSLGYKLITLQDNNVVVNPSLTSFTFGTASPTYATTFSMTGKIDNGTKTVSAVKFKVWNATAGAAGTTYEYTAAYSGGQWIATFDRANHGNNAGTYTAEVYATDTANVTYLLGSKQITLQDKAPTLTSLTYDTTNPTYATTFNMSAAVDNGNRPVTSVILNVWNTNVGRAGSTYAYNAAYANGKWTAAFDRTNHGDTAGTYSIEAYAVDSTGKTYSLGYKLITLKDNNVVVNPSLTSLTFGSTSPTYATTFSMTGKIDNGTKTVSTVKFKVWNATAGAAGTTYEYTAAYSGGQWTATFDRANHGNNAGTYTAEVYATDTANVTYLLGSKQITLQDKAPTLTSLTYDTTNPTYATTFNMSAAVDNGNRPVTSVILNVWNTNVGRAGSTYAYDATYENGKWTAAFDRTNHGDTAGTYSIETYAVDSTGKTYSLGYKLITLQDSTVVRDPSLTSLTYGTTNPTYATTFGMTAAIDNGTKTISGVILNVWNTNVGRAGSTYAYNAAYANGQWTATFNRANHGDSVGTYSIEAYAVDSTGKTYALGYKLITLK